MSIRVSRIVVAALCISLCTTVRVGVGALTPARAPAPVVLGASTHGQVVDFKAMQSINASYIRIYIMWGYVQSGMGTCNVHVHATRPAQVAT